MTPLEILERCVDVRFPDLACPALNPPPGMIPLDPNGTSILPTTQNVGIACCVLVGVARLIRIFTRTYIVKIFALEDGIMIAATILFIVFVGLTCESGTVGIGKHQWDITVADLMRSLRRAYVAQLVYCFTIYAVKLGVLLQIKQVFAGTKKDFNYWACWAVIVFVSCGYTANLFIWIFLCVPVEKSWNYYLPGTCNNAKPSIISGIVNLASDIAVLALPIIAVAQLQMSLRKKVAVSAIFATGMLVCRQCTACVASALRLYYSVDHLDTTDYTYWIAIVAASAIAEVAALLLCDCFPTFPRFYKWAKTERHQMPAYPKSSSTYALGTVERRRLVNDEEKHSSVGTAA